MVESTAESSGVGALLRDRRVELGWTMRDLEERSGVDDAVISRIESGAIAQPRLDKLTRLAHAMGLDPIGVIGAVGRSGESNGAPVPLDALLAARYPRLPDEAVERIITYTNRVLRAHHINP